MNSIVLGFNRHLLRGGVCRMDGKNVEYQTRHNEEYVSERSHEDQYEPRQEFAEIDVAEAG